MSDDDKAEGEGFVIKDSRSSQLSEEEAESHDPQESAPPTETGQENQSQQPFLGQRNQAQQVYLDLQNGQKQIMELFMSLNQKFINLEKHNIQV